MCVAKSSFFIVFLRKHYKMEQEEKFTFWKEQEIWLGYLERFPDYWTQGESLKELKENLKDIKEFLSLQITKAV
jgi:hypothetical protein